MDRLTEFWQHFFETKQDHENWWTRKKALWERRNAEIVRIKGNGSIYQSLRYDQMDHYHYLLHVSFFIKQGDHFHMEEQVIPCYVRLKNNKIIDHELVQEAVRETDQGKVLPQDLRTGEERFAYDRRAAVQYAERWWNDYNPDYRAFDVDCTNYVSQCLHAGGAPMQGAPNREKGWWYQEDNWSFSWAVAHSMRWYLSGATGGLKGKEVENAEQLQLGDIICYDFSGDERWDHTTIVTSKDAYGMPLVNAHTDNSRHRYWSYEDSAAWTENINYKFFQIGD